MTGPEEVPRLLHVIWVGSEPPRWVRTNWALWRAALPADVELREWTNAEAKEAFPLMDTFDGYSDRRILPDLMRLELVQRYGGCYVDSDTVPLRDLEFMWADRPAGMWIGAQDGWEGHQGLLNSAFGAVPGHEFVREVLTRAYSNLARGLKNPHHIAGPVVFKKTWLDIGGVDVLSGFNMLYDRHNVTSMRQCKPDFDALRTMLEAPIAHVGVGYGTWTKKELEANRVA